VKEERSALARTADALGDLAGRVIFTALLVLVVYVSARWCFEFGHSLFYQEAAEEAPGRDVEIEIKEGMGVDQVAAMLAKQGIIVNETAFRVQGRLYKTSLYPGSYEVNTSMTPKEILKSLNISKEEYEKRQALAESTAVEDVLGEADEIVDEEQQKAAADSGIQVETDAGGQ